MRKRILLTTLIVTLLGMLVYSVVSASIFHRTLLDDAKEDIVSLAELYDRELYPDADEEDALSLASHFDDMRVTFLDSAGKVTGDSGGIAAGTDLSAEEEVAETLRSGSGFARRQDSARKHILWYCVAKDGVLVRVGIPVLSEGDLIVQTLPTLAWFIVIVIIFSLIFTYFATAYILRPVEELAEQSRVQSVVTTKYSELEPITEILNRKNNELYEQLDVIKREQARVATVQESKNEFIANITHEMNTPLTSIKGFADLLESGSLDEQGRANAVRVIREQSDRLSGLIACIINYNELNDDELPSYECNVGDIAREVAESLRPAIEACGVSLSLDIDEGVTVSSRQERLTEIFGNLIRNAARYNKENGSVTVRVKGGRDPYAEVEDTGIGIAEENLDKVFSRFFTVDKSHSGKHGGFGLGLAVVKKLCDRAGWRLTVKSALGEGTCFKVEF